MLRYPSVEVLRQIKNFAVPVHGSGGDCTYRFWGGGALGGWDLGVSEGRRTCNQETVETIARPVELVPLCWSGRRQQELRQGRRPYCRGVYRLHVLRGAEVYPAKDLPTGWKASEALEAADDC